MPREKSLFIIDLNYLVPLEEVETYLPGHIAFLEKGYADGVFLVSGAKVPRSGGVIIALAPAKAVLEERMSRDPFHVQKIAEYKITEFIAKKHVSHFFG